MRTNESGRSMLEMIGVLVIIGLLTTGGLTGYNYLVQRHRRQETVKEISQLILGIKTGDLSRRHQEGKTIPAQEVVQGPKMSDKGQVIHFPESERSFAVVTNLAGGAFAVSLQLEPGTCQEVLKALDNENIMMFDPDTTTYSSSAEGFVARAEAWANGSQGANGKGYEGLKYGKASKEELKNIMAACNGSNGMPGKMRWVFNCPEGSSSYGYIYDLLCSGCPVGQMRDRTGACCAFDAEGQCGDLCACPKGTMCDGAGRSGRCVECSTAAGQGVGNAQCRYIYPKKWFKHVCDGNTHHCVECLENSDCHDSRVDYDEPKASETALFCVNQRCIECNANYGFERTSTVIPCSSDKPMCKNEKCEPCPVDQVWDSANGECVCANGKIKGVDGQCVACVDNTYDYGTDRGCDADPNKPICFDSAKEKNRSAEGDFGQGGTSLAGDKCYECLIDQNCKGRGQNYYCGKNYTCEKCDEAWDTENRECRPCQDNNSGAYTDKGCAITGKDATKKLCKPDGSNDNGTNLFGDECRLCRNNNYGNNNPQKDEGCSDTKPLCHAADGTYGDACEVCQNDREGGERDSGCNETEKPLCQASSDAFGSQCAVCQNDKSGIEVDSGCTKDKPMCDGAENGGYGSMCTNCPVGQVWNPAKGECAVCYDDKTGANTDKNCGSGTWSGKPICVTPDKKNDASNGSGNSCAVCQNDKTEGVDTGCSNDKPLCNATQGDFGNQCRSCAEADASRPTWNGKVCEVCFDTKTAAAQDQGCGTGAWAGKNLCGDTPNEGKGVTGTACFKCRDDHAEGQVDSGCDSANPNCDVTNGKYGNTCSNCSGPDKCINAQGQCINVNNYIDLYRGANGMCTCYEKLISNHVSDALNSCKLKDWDNSKKRLTSNRQRYYKTPSSPANFYCTYKFKANGSADDFVVEGSSDGIYSGGKNNTHDSWGEAQDNTIGQPWAKTPVHGNNQQKTVVVQDRWLREVGYDGTFEFHITNANGLPYSKTKSGIAVDYGWKNGGICDNIGDWRNKD